jgi:hypothetical protein
LSCLLVDRQIRVLVVDKTAVKAAAVLSLIGQEFPERTSIRPQPA